MGCIAPMALRQMQALYNDTVHLFSASVLARNMGFQLKKYDGQQPMIYALTLNWELLND